MFRLRHITGLLLISTALYAAPAAAQAGGAPPQQTPPSVPTDPAPADPAADPAQPAEEEVEVSAPGADPGGEIVVRGTRRNIIRTTPEVMSVLSAEDISRTGEGDIAGALQRVTGLSVVGNGFVYVRGLGDRYSLALLNGLALPSPEPLRRVVPLDIFPTSVLASAAVQKSYSVNYPAEFGGGVINLTTSTIPTETYLGIGGSQGANSETTDNLGYTYYGSNTDWLGFDNGTRDIPRPLQDALNSGSAISEGSGFTREEIQGITASLANSRTTVVQRNGNIPQNWGVDLSGGTAFDVGSAKIGVLASAGLSNSWRTRDSVQQTQLDNGIGTDFRAVRTDHRVVANGLLSIAAELGEHQLRWTNLIIRDTLKLTRLAEGFDIQLGDPVEDGPAQQINQRTAWFERQLINSQIIGEFDFGDFEFDARGGYANSRRDAPYERNFSYAYSEEADDYINTLTANAQSATVSFSELTEDVWNFGADASYKIPSLDGVTVSAGAAYLDTRRVSSRRDFAFRPADSVNLAVAQQRPDFLLSDFNVYTFDILLVETSALGGIAEYEGDLNVVGAYVQATANILPEVRLSGGVRYEKGKQSVTLVDLFDEGGLAQTPAVKESYFFPAATLTWSLRPEMQLRLHGSKTLARPQFRELAPQAYFDTESDRQFFGNPFLTDSILTNAEARYEWYFGSQQRVSAAAFFKHIDKPIEALATFTGGASLLTTFANAPSARLYGVELELQKHFGLGALGFGGHRLVTIGNYTFSESKIRVKDGDTTILNDLRGERPASEVFRNGDALTGQSRHIANFQLGVERIDSLQQATLLLNYSSPRVTSRGPSSGEARQEDFTERPGLTLDFIARQGVKLRGREAELKFEARNLLGTDYRESQKLEDGGRVDINRYDLGASVSVSGSIKL
ncbi:MAG: TonB-dependent receptor plug domain-containing protein [Sphingomonas sp.]|nr:TonB-dependent receptor plug domain-containing protein [Sphingomonas sp.]